MKVSELVEKLLTFEGDLEVALYDHEYGEYYPVGEPKEKTVTMSRGVWGDKKREDNVRVVLL